MDPSLWKVAVEAMKNELNELVDNVSTELNQNYGKYASKLDSLDQYIMNQSSTIDSKFLVTQHDAFAYFAAKYNFTTKSLQGISTNSDTGIEELNNLTDFVIENKINAVFVESTVTPANIQSLIDAAAAKNHTVTVGGILYVGNLVSQAPLNTYIGMMEHNIDTVTEGLTSVPSVSSSQSSLPFSYSFIIGIFLTFFYTKTKGKLE